MCIDTIYIYTITEYMITVPLMISDNNTNNKYIFNYVYLYYTLCYHIIY